MKKAAIIGLLISWAITTVIPMIVLITLISMQRAEYNESLCRWTKLDYFLDLDLGYYANEYNLKKCNIEITP